MEQNFLLSIAETKRGIWVNMQIQNTRVFLLKKHTFKKREAQYAKKH